MTTLAEKLGANRPAAGGNPAAAKGHPAEGNTAGAKGHAGSGGAAPAKTVAPNASGSSRSQTTATPAEKPRGPVLAPEKRKALGRGLESLLGPRRVESNSAGVRPAVGAGSSGAAAPDAGVAGIHGAGERPAEAERGLGQAGEAPASTQAYADAPATGTSTSAAVVEGQAASAPDLANAGLGPQSTAANSEMASPASTAGSPELSGAGTGHSAGQGSSAGWHAPVAGTFTGANPAVPQGGRTDGAGSMPETGQAPSLPAMTAAGSAGDPIPGTLMAVDAASGVTSNFASNPGQIGPDIQAQAARRAADGSVIVELDVNLIDKNPYQTRHFTAEDDEELLALAESIKSQGLIQPITVRPGRDGRYILITGQRRTNATRLAGLGTIAAVVRHVSDQQAAEMTVIENLMREDLNVMDQVRAFVMLSTTFQMTQSQIAGRIGSSRESVSNYMRLARLPDEVQGFLRNNELEFSHARLLLRLQDDGVILRVARKAAEEHMSVEALEDLVREKAYPVEGQEKKQGKARWVDPNVRAAQTSLERVLGMRVRIRDSRGKGKILIEYGSLEDFDRLVKVLGGKG